MEERFLYLVKQQLAQRISDVESRELQELLDTHHDLQQIYQALFSGIRIDSEDDLLEAEQSYAAQAVRIHLDGAFDPEAKQDDAVTFSEAKSRSRKKYLVIGSCVIAVAMAIQLYFPLPWQDKNSVQKNQVGTKKGSKTHIILPDGTSVWLNADSKIIYPGNFQGDTREVSLAGEAFFDVVKDPQKPFIIHTGAMDVKVLGTVFNVRSYPDEITTEASLLHGMIEVTLNGKEKKKIILKPNEKLTVLNEAMSETPVPVAMKKKIAEETIPILAVTRIHYNKKDSSNAETSWVYNKLSFDNETIDRVLSKIEQWYNIEIQMNDENIQSKHFTATFENKSLNEVMEALALSLNFAYQQRNGKIIIRQQLKLPPLKTPPL